jgi:hypothetical protein
VSDELIGIAGQVGELKGTVSGLVARVDTLEGKIETLPDDVARRVQSMMQRPEKAKENGGGNGNGETKEAKEERKEAEKIGRVVQGARAIVKEWRTIVLIGGILGLWKGDDVLSFLNPVPPAIASSVAPTPTPE